MVLLDDVDRPRLSPHMLRHRRTLRARSIHNAKTAARRRDSCCVARKSNDRPGARL
jgi:hypothetical protein